MGQMLLVLGGVILLVGAFLYFGGGFGALGKLPGDIRVEGKGGVFYAPIATSIIISLILTVLLNLFLFLRSR
ncbi:MAG TPA: DUF2905 domain-containing protein [bacterium]|nr:DUF2905 domain-containing protein [bacterium]